MRRYDGRQTPALCLLRRTAQDLGPLLDRVVFIGGAIAPLLQTSPVLPRVRTTTDVDRIAAAGSYREFYRLQEELRGSGFREIGVTEGGLENHHAHKWRTPSGGEFDLMPAGDHLGGTGSRWDSYAIESCERLDIGSGLDSNGDAASQIVIQHASAAAFLALKWAAYDDRGGEDPRYSHDLEDIVALVASRPTLPDECADAPDDVRSFIATHSEALLADADFDEVIDGHLGLSVQEAVELRGMVRERLQLLAGQWRKGPDFPPLP